MDYQYFSMAMGIVNAALSLSIWRRGQPKFALLIGALWLVFTATQNSIQTLSGLCALGLFAVCHLYYKKPRKPSLMQED